MGKFKYKLKHTGTFGARITRLAITKKEALKVKSNMLKANSLNRMIKIKPRFRNIRISKNK